MIESSEYPNGCFAAFSAIFVPYNVEMNAFATVSMLLKFIFHL